MKSKEADQPEVLLLTPYTSSWLNMVSSEHLLESFTILLKMCKFHVLVIMEFCMRGFTSIQILGDIFD